MIRHFMVTFQIPDPMPDELIESIPDHRNHINNMLAAGKIVSYTLSMDRTNLWAIFQSDSIYDLEQSIESLPLIEFLTYEYHEIMFHNAMYPIQSTSSN